MNVDFFIVGAPKAGSTSLYHYLDEHPQIEMSSQKEPDYFTDKSIQKQGMYYGKNRIDTLEKYHSLFIEKEGVIYGEGSVSYLFYKHVAEDIKKYNSKAKIIIMLRNPIDRAYSHYLMDYRLGLVNDSFEDIINKTSKHKNAHMFYQQYIEVSEYAEQVKRYLNVFDTDNILLIDYENFKNSVSETVDAVYDFLDVSTEFCANVNKKHNAFSMPKNKIIRFIYSWVLLRNFLNLIFPKSLAKKIRVLFFKNDKKPRLSVSTRQQLNKYFRKNIKSLGLLLNKDFTKWIK